MTGTLRAAIGLAAAWVGAGLALPGTAFGDTPIGERIAGLIGQERAAVAAVGVGRVRQFLVEPDQASRLLYDDAWLRGLPVAEGGREFECLATALYFEARGESIEGQFAVAEVILNRVDAPQYPDSICDVVYQGASSGGGCQFSFACDGLPERIGERRAFERAAKIARLMKDGAPRLLTEGATHFHTRSVNPRWSRAFARTAAIGAHLFYRQPGVALARN